MAIGFNFEPFHLKYFQETNVLRNFALDKRIDLYEDIRDSVQSHVCGHCGGTHGRLIDIMLR